MPIQRNLDDLEIFCVKLLDKGYKKSIGMETLRYEIARKFGYSNYILKSTINALIEFGLIKQVDLNRYTIRVMKDRKEREKEAEKEADKRLGELE